MNRWGIFLTVNRYGQRFLQGLNMGQICFSIEWQIDMSVSHIGCISKTVSTNSCHVIAYIDLFKDELP